MAPRKRPASMHAPFALASTSSPGGSRSHPAVLRPDFRIPDQADTASVSRNRIVSPRASVRSGRIGRRPTPIRPRQPLDPSPSPTGASEHARGNQAWRRTAQRRRERSANARHTPLSCRVSAPASIRVRNRHHRQMPPWAAGDSIPRDSLSVPSDSPPGRAIGRKGPCLQRLSIIAGAPAAPATLGLRA